MGYIEIPAIDVLLPIYHGVGEDSLERGAGHMPSTSLPIGGRGTHAVISAHSGMATARMFTDLERLEAGDVFYLHVLNEALSYEVDQILVVKPYQIDALKIDRARLCNPDHLHPRGQLPTASWFGAIESNRKRKKTPPTRLLPRERNRSNLPGWPSIGRASGTA